MDEDPNPETQLVAVRQFCRQLGWTMVGEYVDSAAPSDYRNRPQWAQLHRDARHRKFQIILVQRLDRAFASVHECVDCLKDWHERGVYFRSLMEDVIDTRPGQGDDVLQIMSAMAAIEPLMTGDRVAVGMARSRASGRQMGRHVMAIPVSNISDALQASENVTMAAKSLGCSRAYIYQELAKVGLTPGEVIRGQAPPGVVVGALNPSRKPTPHHG